MRSKTVLLILSSISIIIIVSAFVYYQASIKSNVHTSTPPNVKITYFSLNGYSNPVGIIWDTKFILKVFNNASTPISGLTVTFNITNGEAMNRTIDLYQPVPDGSYIGSISMEEPYNIGTLGIGETKEVNGAIQNNLMDFAKLSGTNFVATLKLNGIVIDDKIIPPN